MRFRLLVAVLSSALCSSLSLASAETVRRADIVVDGGAVVPPDLLQPEGRTRWDLTGVTLGATWSRTIGEAGAALSVRDDRSEALASSALLVSDAGGGPGATRWLHPERFASELGGASREVLRLQESRNGSAASVRIEVERVGIGWVHLPTGPREVFLQRAVVTDEGKGARAPRIIHRWVDPSAGIVAEVWGAAAPGDKSRIAVEGGSIRTDLEAVATLTKMYDGEVITPPLSAIGYGWDRGSVPVASLTTPSYASANALIAASVWDFSATGVRHAVSGTTTASASTTIAGTGTHFTTELAVDDWISLSPAPTTYARVTAISNDTSLTVGAPLGNGSVQTILRKSGEVASTTVAVAPAETCNSERCGYNLYHTDPTVFMDREDRDFDLPGGLSRTNAVSQRIETPGSDVTYWLRGGAQQEGEGGALGEGESKFCYQTEGAETRTAVPLWRFKHVDAGGYYFQTAPAAVSGTTSASAATTITGAGTHFTTELAVGDRIALSSAPATFARVTAIASDTSLTVNAALGNGSSQSILRTEAWSSTVISSCEQDLWAQNCSTSGGLTLYAKSCAGHMGLQRVEVLKGGVVVSPSGHTFNAVLVRNIVDYCVYLSRIGSTCAFKTADVRGVIYLWQTPHLGTLVRVHSLEAAPPAAVADLPDPTTLDFTKILETNVQFGLFPPRTIQVTGTTAGSVTLSWDPGLDTHRISAFKVYWDTDSGSATSYAFDSDHQAGQVAFAGSGATVSGLNPGTTYYFTVTAKTTFTNPSTAVVTTYESPLYPTQISGDPSFVYPIEVQASTTGGGCTPTAEVTGLRVDRDVAGVRVCWNATVDACAVGYRVLGAASPASDAGFTTAGDTVGLETCWTGNPAGSYLLVVARGANAATGPWGHFGR